MKEEKGRKVEFEGAEESARLEFSDPRLFRDLLGHHDEHLKIIQRTLGIKLRVRGLSIEIEGDTVEAELADKVLKQLYGLLEKGYPVYGSDVDYAIRILSGDGRANLQDIFLDTIYISAHKRVITPKSVAQRLTSTRSAAMTLSSALGLLGPGRLIWPWLWPWRNWARIVTSGSS